MGLCLYILAKFKDHPRLMTTKKKKCLKDSEELSVVNPSWHLNYTTLEGHHKITM